MYLRTHGYIHSSLSSPQHHIPLPTTSQTFLYTINSTLKKPLRNPISGYTREQAQNWIDRTGGTTGNAATIPTPARVTAEYKQTSAMGLGAMPRRQCEATWFGFPMKQVSLVTVGKQQPTE